MFKREGNTHTTTPVTINIGKSVVFKGDLSGSEDITIEGQIDGKIELRQSLVTIGPNARIKAQIFAKAVIVEGHVVGNITAGERIDIRDNGVVEGNLSSPRVSIADGARFRGTIDMQGSSRESEGPSVSKSGPMPLGQVSQMGPR